MPKPSAQDIAPKWPPNDPIFKPINYRSRKWLLHDLSVLLGDIKDRGLLSEDSLKRELADLTDAQLDALVGKAATLHEAIGLA